MEKKKLELIEKWVPSSGMRDFFWKRIAVIERDPNYTGKIKMISLRARGVLRIIWISEPFSTKVKRAERKARKEAAEILKNGTKGMEK